MVEPTRSDGRPEQGTDHRGEFEGCGIYYAATELEARRCAQSPVAIIGGANSAGQAALFLAERYPLVTLIAGDQAGIQSYFTELSGDNEFSIFFQLDQGSTQRLAGLPVNCRFI